MGTMRRLRILGIAAILLGSACHVYVDQPHYYAQRRRPPPPAAPAPQPMAYAPAPSSAPQSAYPTTSMTAAQPMGSASPALPPTYAVSPVPTPQPGYSATPETSESETAFHPFRRRPRPAPSSPNDGSASALSCLDSGPAPVIDCSKVRAPDLACGAASPSTLSPCTGYEKYFDAKVAAAAVSCLELLNKRQRCDPSQTSECARTALGQACPDAEVRPLCRIAAGACKTTQGECAAVVSGLNDTGQEAIARCVAEGCSGGLYGCLDALTGAARL
jgi:hypothetical protein